MAAGAPEKYSEEMIEKVEHYLANYKSIPYEDEVPQMASIAILLGIGRSTLYEWMNKDDHELSDTLRKASLMQEVSLINGGLSGSTNSAITKLILSKHGYSEKQEVNQTTQLSVGALTDEELEAIARSE